MSAGRTRVTKVVVRAAGAAEKPLIGEALNAELHAFKEECVLRGGKTIARG